MVYTKEQIHESLSFIDAKNPNNYYIAHTYSTILYHLSDSKMQELLKILNTSLEQLPNKIQSMFGKEGNLDEQSEEYITFLHYLSEAQTESDRLLNDCRFVEIS